MSSQQQRWCDVSSLNLQRKIASLKNYNEIRMWKEKVRWISHFLNFQLGKLAEGLHSSWDNKKSLSAVNDMIMLSPINLAQNLSASLFAWFGFCLGFFWLQITVTHVTYQSIAAPTAHPKINSKQVNSSSELYNESVIFHHTVIPTYSMASENWKGPKEMENTYCMKYCTYIVIGPFKNCI